MSVQAHALYRFYDDNDRLLYVGITADIGSRVMQHAADKPWWFDVARIDVAKYPTRGDVLAAESKAIQVEKPLHNVTYNGPRRSRPPVVTKRPETLSLQEAAEVMRVSVKTIRRYIAAGRLTGYRMGGHLIRVDLDELRGLLAPIPTAR